MTSDSAPTSEPLRAQDRRALLVRRVEMALCFLLLVQFLFGMAVNLFVKIPDDHPGTNPTEYFSGVAQSVTWATSNGGLWLASHAGTGLLLVL